MSEKGERLALALGEKKKDEEKKAAAEKKRRMKDGSPSRQGRGKKSSSFTIREGKRKRSEGELSACLYHRIRLEKKREAFILPLLRKKKEKGGEDRPERNTTTSMYQIEISRLDEGGLFVPIH